MRSHDETLKAQKLILEQFEFDEDKPEVETERQL